MIYHVFDLVFWEGLILTSCDNYATEVNPGLFMLNQAGQRLTSGNIFSEIREEGKFFI